MNGTEGLIQNLRWISVLLIFVGTMFQPTTAASTGLLIEDPDFEIKRERIFDVARTDNSGAHENSGSLSVRATWLGKIIGRVLDTETDGRRTCAWMLKPVILREFSYHLTSAPPRVAANKLLGLPEKVAVNGLLAANVVQHTTTEKSDCSALQAELNSALVIAKDLLSFAFNSQINADLGTIESKLVSDKAWKLVDAREDKAYTIISFEAAKGLDTQIAQIYCLAYLSGDLPTRTIFIQGDNLVKVLRRTQTIYREVTPALLNLIRLLNIENADLNYSDGLNTRSTGVAPEEAPIACNAEKPPSISVAPRWRKGAQITIPSLPMEHFFYWRELAVPKGRNASIEARAVDLNLFRNFDRYTGETKSLANNGARTTLIRKRNPFLKDLRTAKNVRVTFLADGLRTRLPKKVFNPKFLEKNGLDHDIREKYRVAGALALKNKTPRGNGVQFLNPPIFDEKTRQIETVPSVASNEVLINAPRAQVVESHAATISVAGMQCPDDATLGILKNINVHPMDIIVDKDRKNRGSYPSIGVFDKFPRLPLVRENEKAFLKQARTDILKGADEEILNMTFNVYARRLGLTQRRVRVLIQKLKDADLFIPYRRAEYIHKEFHWPKVNDDIQVPEEFTHGVQMASIIGARCNNFGILGVSSGSIVTPLPNASATDLRGVFEEYLIAPTQCNPSCIVNISGHMGEIGSDLGAKNLIKYDETISGVERKILFVAAAGQRGDTGVKICGKNSTVRPVPACYPHHDSTQSRRNNVITVTSGRMVNIPQGPWKGYRRPELFDWANYGDNVEVAAPGKGVELYDNAGKVLRPQGTSVSTAIVSGLAAEIIARAPNANPFAVRARLLYTADLQWNFGGKVRFGWVNGRRALDKPEKDVLTLLSGEKIVGELKSTVHPRKYKSKKKQIHMFSTRDPEGLLSKGGKLSPVVKFNSVLRLTLNPYTGLYDIVYIHDGALHLARNVNFYADGLRAYYCGDPCRLDDGFEIRTSAGGEFRKFPLEHIKDLTASITRATR